MYQFWHTHLTTLKSAFHNFDKYNYLSKTQRTDWQGKAMIGLWSDKNAKLYLEQLLDEQLYSFYNQKALTKKTEKKMREILWRTRIFLFSWKGHTDYVLGKAENRQPTILHLLLIQSCQYFDGREAVGATERGWFSHQSRPKGQLTAVLPSHRRRGRRSRALLFISTAECRSVVQISGEISRVGATGRYYCKALQFYQHRYTMHKLLADSI